MNLFEVATILLSITAILGWFSHQVLHKLSDTIAFTISGILASVVVLFVAKFVPGVEVHLHEVIGTVNLYEIVFHGVLAFLLFSSALHLNLKEINSHRISIFTLATLGVVISMFVVGALFKGAAGLLGFEMPWVIALMFGAIISPTDPVSVIAIIKQIGLGKDIEAKIAGESLFNDGTGVVAFMVLFGIYQSGVEPTLGGVMNLLALEVLGGAAVGVVIGMLAHKMLETTNHPTVEIVITIATAMVAWQTAEVIHASAPIATVAAGIFVGAFSDKSMSQKTQEAVFPFWMTVDEVLNALLFTVVGLVLITVPMEFSWVALALLAIPICLIARGVSVGIPVLALKGVNKESARLSTILTWGGLRGALSLAMVVSLPSAMQQKGLLFVSVYAVVLFSIIVQGTTLNAVINKISAKGE
ncbi:MAG TPA: sodium:proton antiporter [Methanosarcina sp.]|nr:sodium:proton antiporter [Methanosarcina sp.]